MKTVSETVRKTQNKMMITMKKMIHQPFAKLKTYNIRSNTGSDEKNDTKHPNNTSCKFIRKGKLSEFKITQDIEINEPKQKMTFASFKAMFINDTKA